MGGSMKKYFLYLCLFAVSALTFVACDDDDTNPVDNNTDKENFLKVGNYWISEYTESDETGNLDPTTTKEDSSYVKEKIDNDGVEYYRVIMEEDVEDGEYLDMRFDGKKLYFDFGTMMSDDGDEYEEDEYDEEEFDTPFDSTFFANINPGPMADFGTSTGAEWTVFDFDTTLTWEIMGYSISYDVAMAWTVENVGTKEFTIGDETIEAVGFKFSHTMTRTEGGEIISSLNAQIINYLSYEKGFIHTEELPSTETYPDEETGETITETYYGGITKLLRYHIAD
jgi:hypothetical protein